VPKTSKPEIKSCDLPGNRCYIRDIGKGVSLQMYDSGSNGGAVILEFCLHANAVRKHRELIAALFAWAKEG
jgi:hypothetical protein